MTKQLTSGASVPANDADEIVAALNVVAGAYWIRLRSQA
jgi:hypothetical protein